MSTRSVTSIRLFGAGLFWFSLASFAVTVSYLSTATVGDTFNWDHFQVPGIWDLIPLAVAVPHWLILLRLAATGNLMRDSANLPARSVRWLKISLTFLALYGLFVWLWVWASNIFAFDAVSDSFLYYQHAWARMLYWLLRYGGDFLWLFVVAYELSCLAFLYLAFTLFSSDEKLKTLTGSPGTET